MAIHADTAGERSRWEGANYKSFAGHHSDVIGAIEKIQLKPRRTFLQTALQGFLYSFRKIYVYMITMLIYVFFHCVLLLPF